MPEAVTLDALSYNEAIELAYFGAKVLHPSTMAPAVERGLPIIIRNTFRPEHPGTRVRYKSPDPQKWIGSQAFGDRRDFPLPSAGLPGIVDRQHSDRSQPDAQPRSAGLAEICAGERRA